MRRIFIIYITTTRIRRVLQLPWVHTHASLRCTNKKDIYITITITRIRIRMILQRMFLFFVWMRILLWYLSVFKVPLHVLYYFSFKFYLFSLFCIYLSACGCNLFNSEDMTCNIDDGQCRLQNLDHLLENTSQRVLARVCKSFKTANHFSSTQKG